MNLVIAMQLGADALGVFNQIYAIFVIAGQIAVFGLHDSAQKYVAEFRDSPRTQHLISIAAVYAVSIFGLAGAVVVFLTSPTIAELTKSLDVGRGVLLLSPGLFVFVLNKVLMGVINGQRRMTAFAAAQSVRALVILAVCLMIVMEKRPFYEFGWSFTLAEVALLGFILVYVRPLDFRKFPVEELILWARRHTAFGSRALAHGFLSEAFIRVDILILGVFLADREVGIYSFAAFFIEGLYQIPIVIRNINNPILVRLLLAGDRESLANFSRKTALLSFAATLAVAAPIALAYPKLALFLQDDLVTESLQILLVLMAGLLVYSAFIPFDYIFLQAGRPGTQSLFMATNSAINAGLNISFIPVWGLYGASGATAIAFVLSGATLNLFAWLFLKLPGGILGLGESVE